MAHRSIRKLSLVAALTAVAVIVAGCPGTDRSTSPPNGMTTDTILSASQQTGSIYDGEGSGQPAVAYPSTDVMVGDQDGLVNGTAVRGFIGFDISGLPAGITIRQATITATQCAFAGFPFDNLGDVVVQHMSYAVPLDTLAFFANPIDASLDTLSDTTTLGPRTITVTSSVSADFAAKRASSQYRLSMSSTDYNGDGVSDYVVFATDSAHTYDCKPVGGQQPRLIILYQSAANP
jgi:hypothetical protein